MRTLTNLVEHAARGLVWHRGKSRRAKKASVVDALLGIYEEDYPSVHGIGIGGTHSDPRIEVYVPTGTPRRRVNAAVSSILGPGVQVSFVRCQGFSSYQTLSAGDGVRHEGLRGYGTLGGFVNDLFHPYVLALSNNHVLAKCNSGAIGDSLIEASSGRAFGKLHRFVALKPPPSVNEVDAAVGLIYTGIPLQWRPKKPRQSGLPRRGMRVYKLGAKTGYTEGVITAVSASVQVNYRSSGVFNFRRCLRIVGTDGPFALPGDSGSFVVSDAGTLVGLVFAGENTGAYSLASSFKYTEQQLGVVFQ